jgi:hypothetical protein
MTNFYLDRGHCLLTLNQYKLEHLFKIKLSENVLMTNGIFTYLSLSTPKEYTPIGPPALRAANPIVG